ncbi:MAG: M48 family metalloprotease, partial [Pseudomonadota bacterium]
MPKHPNLNRLFAPAIAALALFSGACSVNPVTGEREVRLVSRAQEIQLGTQNYAPMRQSQGGDYVLDPALNDYVRSVGQRVAAFSDNDLPYEFTVLNNSVPNAWALPGGKIAINRGLLTELDSEAELAAVLGHEVIHAAAGHSAQQITRGMLLQTGILATAIAANDSDYGNLWVGGANVAAQLINQRYGRGAELEADRYGMRYMSRAGYDPYGAVELQQTFVRLSEGRRNDWLSGLFASHPPSAERVAANRATAAALPDGGERGVEQYRAAMAKTLAAVPAYEAYDEGRAALADGRTDEAESKARTAVRQLPGEGHMHALLGDIDFSRKRYSAARKHYTAAIDRHDGFFYYHLQRGRVNELAGNDDAAAADLEASVALLPTAPAYLGLGNIARRQQRLDEARQYFAEARQADGQLGLEAETALLEIDLADNPGQYLQQRAGLSQQGELIVQIVNPNRVAVAGLELAIRYVGGDGRAQTVRRALRGTLAGGQSTEIA